jgi:hypothetical protein
VGPYIITIAHDDSGDCPVTEEEQVFKFEFESYRFPDWDNGSHAPPHSFYSRSLGLAKAKADEETPTQSEYGATVIWCYKIQINVIPQDSYSGGVKARAIVRPETSGIMALRNGPPSCWPSTEGPSLSLSYGIVSASISEVSGLCEYGSSLAGANISSQIADGTEMKCVTRQRNWQDVGIPLPIWGLHYKYGTWEDVGMYHIHEDIKRAYMVGNPVPVYVKAETSAQISKLIFWDHQGIEIITRSPVVLNNQQTISNVEVYLNEEGFEIPVQ